MATQDMDDDRFAPADVIEGEVVESTSRALVKSGTQVADFANEDMAMAVAISQASLDQQIVTARAHRRSVQNCLDNIMTLATLTKQGAEECNYAIPRDGKVISGPSIRLMEIVGNQWGNNRYGVMSSDVDRVNKVVKVMAYHHDLETNSRIETLVTRRISTKNGKIFGDDMIAVTANAAGSIALRNAIKQGIPRPVWSAAYTKVLEVIRGDEKSLAARRVDLLTAFKKELSIAPEVLYRALGVKGEADIDLDKLVVARGFFAAIRNNEITIDDLLRSAAPAAAQAGANTTLAGAFGNKRADGEPAAAEGPKEAADPKKELKPKAAAKKAEEPAHDKETGEVAPDPTKTASAPPADADPASSGSATNASTASQGETSGQPALDLPSPDGDQSEDQDEDRDEEDTTVVGEDEDEDEGDGDDDQGGDAAAARSERIRFEGAVENAKSWGDAFKAFGEYRKTDGFRSSEPKGQTDTAKYAYDRIVELDGPEPSASPQLFTLWVRTAPKHDVIPTLTKLIKTKAYQDLPEEIKDAIADQVDAATK